MEPGKGVGGARRPKEGVGAVATAVCRQGGDCCYSCVIIALPALVPQTLSTALQPSESPSLECVTRKPKKVPW